MSYCEYPNHYWPVINMWLKSQRPFESQKIKRIIFIAGLLMFYDLRAGKYLESNIHSSKTVTLRASRGYVVSRLFSFFRNKLAVSCREWVIVQGCVVAVPRRGGRRLQPGEVRAGHLHALLRRQRHARLHGRRPAARAAHRQLRRPLAVTPYPTSTWSFTCTFMDLVQLPVNIILRMIGTILFRQIFTGHYYYLCQYCRCTICNWTDIERISHYPLELQCCQFVRPWKYGFTPTS